MYCVQVSGQTSVNTYTTTLPTSQSGRQQQFTQNQIAVLNDDLATFTSLDPMQTTILQVVRTVRSTRFHEGRF